MATIFPSSVPVSGLCFSNWDRGDREPGFDRSSGATKRLGTRCAAFLPNQEGRLRKLRLVGIVAERGSEIWSFRLIAIEPRKAPASFGLNERSGQEIRARDLGERSGQEIWEGIPGRKIGQEKSFRSNQRHVRLGKLHFGADRFPARLRRPLKVVGHLQQGGVRMAGRRLCPGRAASWKSVRLCGTARR
jgi:hypothetical protein